MVIRNFFSRFLQGRVGRHGDRIRPHRSLDWHRVNRRRGQRRNKSERHLQLRRLTAQYVNSGNSQPSYGGHIPGRMQKWPVATSALGPLWASGYWQPSGCSKIRRGDSLAQDARRRGYLYKILRIFRIYFLRRRLDKLSSGFRRARGSPGNPFQSARKAEEAVQSHGWAAFSLGSRRPGERIRAQKETVGLNKGTLLSLHYHRPWLEESARQRARLPAHH